MSVDGAWEVRAHGTGIDRTLRVELRTEGDAVSGEVVDGERRIPISGGRLDGDRLSFAMTVAEPVRARLTAKLTLDGDRMTGGARANLLVSVRLDGRRIRS